jgi:hypothetical protein
MNPIIETVRIAIIKHEFRFSDEADLQEGIIRVLTEHSIPFRREVTLSRRDRVDFMLDEGIALEVKVDGSISALTRQLFRYAEYPKISAIIVVAGKLRLTDLPGEINGKPIICISVMRAFQ